MKIASVLSLPLFAACSFLSVAEPEIDQEHVVRVLSALSADSMEGRETFTPGIEKAAAFLAAEFEDIGLSSFEGNAGFLQSFHVSSLTREEFTVSINGAEIAEENRAAATTSERLSWTDPADFRLMVVGPDDDFGAMFFELRNGDEDVLMFVDPSHRDFFERIRGFLSRPTRRLDLGAGPNTVVVLGNAAEISSVDVQVTNSVEQQGLANVVGVIPGRRADEIVLFSAHYDHIGFSRAVNGDSISNGANDDASGIAAVVELARYFNEMRRPERTLVFAAFTAEEMGGFGSSYFSQQLDPDQIVSMFNIEMIGKPGIQGPNTAWITGFDRSDMGELMQRAVEGTVFSFYPDPYPDQNLFYRSDNATLARLGVPAHSISTTAIDVDTDYHQVSDEIETLDLDHLTNTVRAIAAGARTIVDGDATPTRVNPEEV